MNLLDLEVRHYTLQLFMLVDYLLLGHAARRNDQCLRSRPGLINDHTEIGF